MPMLESTEPKAYFNRYMNDLKKALKPQQSMIENMQTTFNVSNLENRTKNSYFAKL